MSLLRRQLAKEEVTVNVVATTEISCRDVNMSNMVK